MKESLSRRRFLQVLGALGLAQVVEFEGSAQATPPLPQAPQYHAPTPPRGLHALHGAYTFFTVPEARFVEAAVSRLIPADDLGPGALEAGVPQFIDRELQSKFGLAATWYMQGPWGDGTDEQGYQLPLTPREVYRLGIAAVDMAAEAQYGSSLADLGAGDQDAVLTALENGELQAPPLPPRILSTFWDLLLTNTRQGFFSDPAYGGNRDKVGWRLVAFPGVAAAYRGALVPYYNIPYVVEPVSIADIQNGLVETDSSGHALHRDLKTGRVITEVSHEHEH
jgi:gluconate 2-dehydrogenase gamma chain